MTASRSSRRDEVLAAGGDGVGVMTEFVDLSGLTLPDGIVILDTASATGPDFTMEISFVYPSDEVDTMIAATGFTGALSSPITGPMSTWRVEALGENLSASDTRTAGEYFEKLYNGRERRLSRRITIRELGDGSAQVAISASTTS